MVKVALRSFFREWLYGFIRMNGYSINVYLNYQNLGNRISMLRKRSFFHSYKSFIGDKRFFVTFYDLAKSSQLFISKIDWFTEDCHLAVEGTKP